MAMSCRKCGLAGVCKESANTEVDAGARRLSTIIADSDTSGDECLKQMLRTDYGQGLEAPTASPTKARASVRPAFTLGSRPLRASAGYLLRHTREQMPRHLCEFTSGHATTKGSARCPRSRGQAPRRAPVGRTTPAQCGLS